MTLKLNAPLTIVHTTQGPFLQKQAFEIKARHQQSLLIHLLIFILAWIVKSNNEFHARLHTMLENHHQIRWIIPKGVNSKSYKGTHHNYSWHLLPDIWVSHATCSSSVIAQICYYISPSSFSNLHVSCNNGASSTSPSILLASTLPDHN